VIEELDEAARLRRGSLPELVGADCEPLAITIGALALVLLLAGRRDGLVPGLALAAVGALAWVAALAGYGYGLGFVGAAEGTRVAIEHGAALPFQPWLAIGVLAGGGWPATVGPAFPTASEQREQSPAAC
jgi:hypothetical protein